MKLAIFGDSFAVRSSNPNIKSWVDLLDNHYDCVDCYGAEGSPLFISVEKFEQHQQNYDKCVFVIPNPYRYEIRIEERFYFLSNVVSAERHQRAVLPYSKDWWMLEKYKKWIDTVVNNTLFNESKSYIHTSLIEHVKSIRPDTLIIAGFKNSFKDVKFAMEQISEVELSNLDIGDNLNITYEDMRPCHMTANNNNLFKDQVLNILEGKDTEFYLERFLPMPAEEFKNNFRKFK